MLKKEQNRAKPDDEEQGDAGKADNWLAELKAGDLVIVVTVNPNTESRAVKTVSRVTPNHIRIQCDEDAPSDYNRVNGNIRGEEPSRSRDHLAEPTPDMILVVRAEQRRAEILGKLARRHWKAYSLEALERVWAVAEANKPAR